MTRKEHRDVHSRGAGLIEPCFLFTGSDLPEARRRGTSRSLAGPSHSNVLCASLLPLSVAPNPDVASRTTKVVLLVSLSPGGSGRRKGSRRSGFSGSHPLSACHFKQSRTLPRWQPPPPPPQSNTHAASHQSNSRTSKQTNGQRCRGDGA